jgi:hypothetical protein
MAMTATTIHIAIFAMGGRKPPLPELPPPGPRKIGAVNAMLSAPSL